MSKPKFTPGPYRISPFEIQAGLSLSSQQQQQQKAITPLGTVGWVRPEEKTVVDWKGFALACNRCDLQPQFESKQKNDPFLRAWWKK